jgi:glucose-1-phosphate thymidylyltransferase
MKALILAGGSGTRLRPLTYTSAKQLIPIANKPTIAYGIEAIVAAGITDIGIIVGDTKDDIIAELGDGSTFGATFTYIPQDAPRGLAHAVMIAEEFMNGESFLMYLGDNIVRSGVANLVRQFKEEKPNAMVLLNTVPNPQQYGVVELVDGRVKRLVEKPKNPKSNLALVGVYLFDNNIFTAVNSISPSWRNELEITDAIQWLVDQNYQVNPHVIRDWWKDTGKPKDMLAANRLILEMLTNNIAGSVCEKSELDGKIQIDSGAQIINSTIRGPVIIGEGAVIRDSYIGPFTSIGSNVVVDRSEIENSILLQDVSIINIRERIDSSLIGKGASIQSVEKRPKSQSFVLGDRSQVTL